MAEVRVRKAEMTDYAQLLELTLELRRYVRGLSSEPGEVRAEEVVKQVKKYLTAPEHLVLVAVQETRVLGFIRAQAIRGEQTLAIGPEKKSRQSWEDRARSAFRRLRFRLAAFRNPPGPEKTYLYIGDVFVRPEARQQGVGRLLLSAAGQEPVCRSADAIYLNVLVHNDPGQAFWKSQGFSPDSITMIKKR